MMRRMIIQIVSTIIARYTGSSVTPHPVREHAQSISIFAINLYYNSNPKYSQMKIHADYVIFRK